MRTVSSSIRLGIFGLLLLALTAAEALALTRTALVKSNALSTGTSQCPAPAATGWYPLSNCLPTSGTPDTIKIPGVAGTTKGQCGNNVWVDKDFSGLGNIKIGKTGVLAFTDCKLNLQAQSIQVEGSLQAGTDTAPITKNTVSIRFTGDKPATTPVDACATLAPAEITSYFKGILVRNGGNLRLFGAKGVPSPTLKDMSWTHLAKPAGPDRYKSDAVSPRPPNLVEDVAAPVSAEDNATTLHLAKNVTTGPAAWKIGDWIVVASTSFSPFESEFVKIVDLTPEGNGTKITLDVSTPLRHYHFGGNDPGAPSTANFKADASTNYGVDERAEVGLISRNIVLSSDAAFGNKTKHWGGEFRFCKGFNEARIQGVEIEKFGKEALGSYPIHFHMVGDVAAKRWLVDANSIHHSFNKCVTIHSTKNMAVTNNVCARIVGHIFYEEIGDETGISFKNNLGIGASSNWFDIDLSATSAFPVPMADPGLPLFPFSPNAKGWPKNWWEGDYLARANGFDGLSVANTDAKDAPTHGSCYAPPDQTGRFGPNKPPQTVDDIDPQKKVPIHCPSTPNSPGGNFPYYVEAASGFWIVNPGTVLEGNSISGCQGTGIGYWYVPPTAASPSGGKERYLPVGKFSNNRVHGCNNGFFAEELLATVSGQIAPRLGATYDMTTEKMTPLPNIVAHFNGLTATRIRNRGIWVRPMWTAVENSRFATNRDSVTLVSSGGNDGNSPGIWAVLKDSVLVGISQNNVDRWGPCTDRNGGSGAPGMDGCVDMNPKAKELFDLGYQTPRWNSAGYFIYDGPVRILNNRFVNYHKDLDRDNPPLLTLPDRNYVKSFTQYANSPPPPDNARKYEGDAALGWFQSNQSAYPTATVSKGLIFENTSLRHQIFTSRVNFAPFKDGDKNTALIDLDGSLSGFSIAKGDCTANCTKVKDEFPISLNNLEFNRSFNAVDECYAEGQQDEAIEQRPTSLMSPANTATLEFEALYPNPNRTKDDPINVYWQDLKFTKDSTDYGVHQSMILQGRDGRGIWEPKVASGFGYTVLAYKSTAEGVLPKYLKDPGMPKVVRVGFTDAIKSKVGPNNPFYVRIGICYTNTNGQPPANKFTITRGYKSWGGGDIKAEDPGLNKYWIKLENRYPLKPVAGQKRQTCNNLDSTAIGSGKEPPSPPWIYNNFGPSGCPADGLSHPDDTANCPPGTQVDKADLLWVKNGVIVESTPVCVHKKTQLEKAAKLSDLNPVKGVPANKYFYDQATGMLFFYVKQDSANAQSPATQNGGINWGTPSPIGACAKPDGAPANWKPDSACPQADELETYYSCPPEGCVNYSVELNDANYQPGPSKCITLAGGKDNNDVQTLYEYQNKSYTLASPTGQNRLAYTQTVGNPTIAYKGTPVKPVDDVSNKAYLHALPDKEPSCSKPNP